MARQNYIKSIKIGDEFGSWTVIGLPIFVKTGSGKWKTLVPVRCVCSLKKTILPAKLARGETRKCNKCKIIETSARNTTHGQTGSPLHKLWISMRNRCTANQNSDHYKDYGGRGISVCSEWNDFTVFADWAKQNGYQIGKSIDRKNNNKGYSASNCQFTSSTTQANNRRDNFKLTVFGKTMTVTQWSRRYGINPITIFGRLRRGWSIKKALTLPPMQKYLSKNRRNH